MTNEWRGALEQGPRELRRRGHRGAVVQLPLRVERHGVLAISPPAGHVEVVERETDRIHVLMARAARDVLAVQLHALTGRQRLAILAIRRLVERRNVRRRWRRRHAG